MTPWVTSEQRTNCRKCGTSFGTGDGPQYCMYCRQHAPKQERAVDSSYVEVYTVVDIELPEVEARVLPTADGYRKIVRRVLKKAEHFIYVKPKFMLLSSAGWRT